MKMIPARAYVIESKHPECVPEMKFRAVMPDGSSKWFYTLTSAVIAVSDAAESAVALQDDRPKKEGNDES